MVPLWLRGAGGGSGGSMHAIHYAWLPRQGAGRPPWGQASCVLATTRQLMSVQWTCEHLPFPPLFWQELDPAGKFASEWEGWRFIATRGGAVVPFASCCGPQGFLSECQCASRASCK